jgi:citrate lyase beta subunit
MPTMFEHKFPYLYALLSLHENIHLTVELCDKIYNGFSHEWMDKLDSVVARSKFITIIHLPKTGRTAEVYEWRQLILAVDSIQTLLIQHPQRNEKT